MNKSKIIPGFQVPYSEKIKNGAGISSMAVGAIINPDQANDIILNKRADFVALGRELLADTQWVYKAATFFNLENAKSFLPEILSIVVPFVMLTSFWIYAAQCTMHNAHATAFALLWYL